MSILASFHFLFADSECASDPSTATSGPINLAVLRLPSPPRSAISSYRARSMLAASQMPFYVPKIGNDTSGDDRNITSQFVTRGESIMHV
ncbi:uncharacterized protein IAS62_006675 [Cryptococcus decagattii]|uniref:Secreted protein n=1 Tax=Cryptococcus decagattii TaxID=1859122 RepID=A0ABZ2B3K1_9TREE